MKRDERDILHTYIHTDQPNHRISISWSTNFTSWQAEDPWAWRAVFHTYHNHHLSSPVLRWSGRRSDSSVYLNRKVLMFFTLPSIHSPSDKPCKPVQCILSCTKGCRTLVALPIICVFQTLYVDKISNILSLVYLVRAI